MATHGQTSCRVVIVDDHATFTDALARSLNDEAGIEVVGTATTARSGELLALSKRPDVILIDHRLGTTNGIELARVLHASLPSARLLMLTATVETTVAFEAIEAGCIGYLGKDAPLEDVIEAIRSAARDEAVIGSAMLTRMLPRLRSRELATGSGLTDREREILQCLAQGCSNVVIAERLFLSVNTVRNHVHNVITKLGAHSKLEAVARAIDEGLVTSASRASHQ